MNRKTRIKKLTIKGFRGATKKACLDLEDENKNIVLFGNNGDGKTTFSDAIEWFFRDRIDYLSREGCGREDYFNRYIVIAPTAQSDAACRHDSSSSAGIVSKAIITLSSSSASRNISGHVSAHIPHLMHIPLSICTFILSPAC
jgi:hypothetical protein